MDVKMGKHRALFIDTLAANYNTGFWVLPSVGQEKNRKFFC
jgi:hypothetical protein